MPSGNTLYVSAESRTMWQESRFSANIRRAPFRLVAFDARETNEKVTLRQEKNTISGILDWPHGDPIKLAGRFSGDTQTFAGDSGGDNFIIHIDSTGSLQTDGTMSGVFKAHFVDFNDAHAVLRQRDQEIPWRAAREQHGRP